MNNRILFLALLSLVVDQSSARQILADFQSPDGWEVVASDGVVVHISLDEGVNGKGLRIDIDFIAGSGYGGVRRKIDLSLPRNFQFLFDVKGNLPPNNFEFKLVDTTGENVWWVNRRMFEFPRTWKHVRVKKRHLQFAWGPRGGGDLERAGWVEFIVASAEGGKGSVWLDNLVFEERPTEEYTGTPAVSASSVLNAESVPESVLDTSASTVWRSARAPERQWLEIDFGQKREYSGLVIDWERGMRARDFSVAISNERTTWREVFSVKNTQGQKSYIPMLESESRFLRIDLLKSEKAGYGIRAVLVKAEGEWNTPTDVFAAMAQDAPRGMFPRYLNNEQTYWTIVGSSGDSKEALMNEEGMIETDRLGFSLEPFVAFNGTLYSWNHARVSQSLQQEYLPIPSVHWDLGRVALTITAFAEGEAGSSILYAIYEVRNTSKKRVTGNLYITLRPLQVLPPTQWLNITGGAAKVHSIVLRGKTITVNEEKDVVLLSSPTTFGAAEFAQGDITEFLRDGRVPVRNQISDREGYASAAARYAFNLAPGSTRRIVVALPFHPRAETRAMLEDVAGAKQIEQFIEAARRRTVQYWTSKLNIVKVDLPRAAQRFINTARSTLAYVLINRDGPAIQPGSRTYERAWIRDGSLTSSALLRFGLADEVREYIEWYSRYQYANGKVPCVVDKRGPDPVPEHDSHGQLIFAIAQYYRFTKDSSVVRLLWPRVVAAMNYIQELRAQRMTEKYRRDELRAYYGLVPESISHEGYSAKPMHSYWDDFFVLRGMKDASYLASVIGEREDAERYRLFVDEFRNNLLSSISLAMKSAKIDYIPGCVELGDFDATSTAIGIYPGGELSNLPPEAVEHTFERYYEYFEKRARSEIAWENYTPYEIRICGTFLLLGRKDRAHRMLEFFFQHQRPPAWNHWAEVVWRDPRRAAFIGDMPHTWVGSDYLSVFRSLFVQERENDSALVIGAGIREEWVDSAGGVSVTDLPTYYGKISYSAQRGENDNVIYELGGALTSIPQKVVLMSPRGRPIRRVLVDSKPYHDFTASEVRLKNLSSRVVLIY